jgi:hypothetical protein
MQGKCTTQPDAANFPSMNGVPLVPTTSGQCLLYTDDHLLVVTSDSFWADNLYLRSAVPKGDDIQDHFSSLARVINADYLHPSSAFMTHITFQGEGKGYTIGIEAFANVFVSGSHHTCGIMYRILQASDNLKVLYQLLSRPWWVIIYMRLFLFSLLELVARMHIAVESARSTSRVHPQ